MHAVIMISRMLKITGWRTPNACQAAPHIEINSARFISMLIQYYLLGAHVCRTSTYKYTNIFIQLCSACANRNFLFVE